MNAKAVLLRTRELLADPAHWIQHDFAFDGTGDACDALDPNAEKWCLEGAIIRAISDVSPEFEFNTAILGFPVRGDIPHWNDQFKRTHAEVLVRIDAAIENLK